LNLDLYHFSIACISVQCIVPVWPFERWHAESCSVVGLRFTLSFAFMDVDSIAEDWILISTPTPKKRSAPKAIPTVIGRRATSLEQPLKRGGRPAPEFHTCFLDSAINSDSATICHRTVVRKEFSLFVSSPWSPNRPNDWQSFQHSEDLLAGWLILFFPSNAFIASARSLHTLNRSKKMNCNYHARLSTCR
jgi:hypothetical protein